MSTGDAGARTEGRLPLTRSQQVAVASVVLGALCFIPSGARFLLNLSSVAPGLGLAIAIILGLALAERFGRIPGNEVLNNAVRALAIVVLAGVHLVATVFFNPLEYGRLAVSLLLLGLVAFTVPLVVRFFERCEPFAVGRSITYVRWIFVLSAIFGIIGIQPPSGVAQLKPIFPFAEPSHFALTFVPFLVDACANASKAHKLLWLGGTLILAYVLQSLSLVVGIILAGLVCLPLSQLLAGGALLLVVLGLVDIEYFTERLDLSESSGNLSSLVYLQGWDLVEESFARTKGLGWGFMQLGYVPTNVPTADLIYRIFRDDLNLKDGSFTAAKLLSEFGVIGAALIALFAVQFARSAWRVRRFSLSRTGLSRTELLAHSLVVGFLIDMFVRGTGYFSGVPFLLLCGWILTRRLARKAQVGARAEYRQGARDAIGDDRLDPAHSA
jgi:hypothetical protein